MTYFGRKLLVSLITSLLTVMGFTAIGIFTMEPEAIGFGLATAVYVFPAIFLYGLPVSLLSDLSTIKLHKARPMVAFFIHILFVLVPTLIIFLWDYDYSAFSQLALTAPVAVLYWIVDELSRRWAQDRNSDGYRLNGRMTIISAGVVSLVLLAVSFSWVYQNMFPEEITPTVYQIPEGYEGWVQIIYDQDSHPPLTEKYEHLVASIPEEGILRTSSSYEGSSVEDEYYYVDKKGSKKRLELQKDIHGNSMGSFHTQTSDGEDVTYDNIYHFFVGKKEEFEQSSGFALETHLPELRDQKPFHFYIPEDYQGWVQVEYGIEEGQSYMEANDKAIIQVSEDGKAAIPPEQIEYSPKIDKFYFVDSEGIVTEIPEKLVHEVLVNPYVLTFYIGPKEEYEKVAPFDYPAYLKESS
ncbi:DUF6843 domain-containing protein [Pseudalkalibacillus caeni]|uniref:DUF6843 domain-containing protein n=1 Tax=Exobacillus caeni TaxID=2574798 RepID=A0A5R9F119_9BACL|nr:hypothetical protein [Pseudalkalibacillus caeni]TLS37257.1 hypothetical protein FCL54_12085 [Pseudalkalibacillus caeni]